MSGRLAGKVAIITGGAQGIGQGIAVAFAKEGACVLITGRTQETLETTVHTIEAAGGKAAWLVGTAGVRADAEAAAAKVIDCFGRVDILVNNAQSSRPGTSFEEHDDDLFAMTLGSGLYGTFQHMQAVLPHMKESGGSIINFGSREGIFGGNGFAAYAATKEAIRGLTRTAARELGKYAIRVNVVCPAALSPKATEYLENHPDEAAMYLREIALGRFGDCGNDVGPAVLFLASDDSRYVTGQTLNVDGGQMML